MVNKITMWTFLEPLLYQEDFIHLAEISKRLNKNHSVTRQYLNFFEKQGLLTKKLKGRLTMYKINPDFFLIVDYISLIEKEKLIRKCQRDLLIREIVHFLNNTLNENNKALIFGSSVEDSKKPNDIDILITGKFNEDRTSQFEKKFNVKFHIINVKNLKSVNESLRKEIIKKHLIVQGVENIVKWLI